MSENSQRGVAVVQRQIVDASRSMSWDYLLYQVSLLATLVDMASLDSTAGADGSFSSRPSINANPWGYRNSFIGSWSIRR